MTDSTENDAPCAECARLAREYQNDPELSRCDRHWGGGGSSAGKVAADANAWHQRAAAAEAEAEDLRARLAERTAERDRFIKECEVALADGIRQAQRAEQDRDVFAAASSHCNAILQRLVPDENERLELWKDHWREVIDHIRDARITSPGAMPPPV